MTSSDYEELCIYNVITKATTKKAMQRDTKNTVYKSKGNYKNC